MRRRADPTQRLRAVEATRSPKELTDALDDPSPEVVRVAIHRLAELEGEPAAAALRARMLDVDLSLVRDIASALIRLGDHDVAAVASAALRDPRSTRRLAGVRALSAVADGPAVDALRDALDDGVAGVRGAALDALAQLGARAGASAGVDCARLVHDPVPHVRIAAVRAVARLVVHAGPMIAPAAHDADRVVRLAVAQHAASLPRRAARELLEDPDVRVREAAARAAGTREVGALAVLLLDDPAPDVRRAAAHALGGMQGDGVADLLVPSLEDADALVRAAVLHALEQLLGRAGVVRRLCHELAGKRAGRRRASIYALARLNAREAASEISRAVSDRDPEVRLALVHSADVLFDAPRPVITYLSDDPDQSVRDAAEMWLLHARRDES